MKKEIRDFLKRKDALKKDLGRGAVVSVAEKRGVDKAAISVWFSARRITKVDELNMAAAIAVLNEKKINLQNLTRAAIAA